MFSEQTWRGAELSRLLGNQLLIGGPANERITFDGPPVLLAPQAALHIALISYELGTNARKCGSLSAPRGELHVGWRIETRGEARVLHLTWAERDGPAASLRSAPPSARSDGLLTLWRIWHFDELFVEL